MLILFWHPFIRAIHHIYFTSDNNFCKFKHTHPFNGPFSGTTRVSRYQKGKTNLDFTDARDSEWQWHLLGHMQVCISLQTDNHASTPPLVIFTGMMPFLPPNQQRQSTEGKANLNKPNIIFLTHFEQLVKCCLITVGIGRNLSLLHALPLPVNRAFSALRHIRLG